jgi:hypothetical protein
MIKSKINRDHEINRILYPIADTSVEDNTAWVGELCIRTGFQLALIDFTDQRKGGIDDLIKEIKGVLNESASSLDDLEVINTSNLTDNIRDDEDIAIIPEGILQVYQKHATPHDLPLIVLPDNHHFSKWNNQGRIDTTKDKSKHFFQILKQAEKQRLPHQIFKTLANDNYLFNEFLEQFRKK